MPSHQSMKRVDCISNDNRYAPCAPFIGCCKGIFFFVSRKYYVANFIDFENSVFFQ